MQWLVQVGDTVAAQPADLPGRDRQGAGRHPLAVRGHGAHASRAARRTVLVGAPLITIEEATAGAQSAAPKRASARAGGLRHGRPGAARSRGGGVALTRQLCGAASHADRLASDSALASTRARPARWCARSPQERGIDLALIAGTGPGGRIRVEDLERCTGACGQPPRTRRNSGATTRSASAPSACARPSPPRWCGPRRRSHTSPSTPLRRRRGGGATRADARRERRLRGPAADLPAVLRAGDRRGGAGSIPS